MTFVQQIVDGVGRFCVLCYFLKLKELVVAEIEFETMAESTRFVPPSWFGKNLTNNARYSNAI